MNPIEELVHHYCLLFWFIGERNWTIQSTSSIVKPRKEPNEYEPGDIVLAKFRGKVYRAVVIKNEADKDKLEEDKLRFDKLLHNASLSPKQILQEMGIDADLDATSDNGQVKTPTHKRPANQQPANVTKKRQPKKCQEQKENGLVDALKTQEKQKKIASLESSKLTAARLLQKTKPDEELQPSLTQLEPFNTALYTQSRPLSQLQQPSVSSSIFSSIPHTPTQNETNSSSLSVPFVHNSVSSPTVSPLASSFLPHYPTSQTRETFTPSQQHSFQTHMDQSFQSPNQTALPPSQNFYQHTGSLFDSWNYSGSASEMIASNLTTDTVKPTLDCSKCSSHIYSHNASMTWKKR